MRLGLVLLCGCLLYAQSQPAAQDKCRLEGKVLNSVTGQGVRKVRVNLMRTQRSAPGAPQPAQTSAGTDPQGSFVFDSLDAGSYMITVQRDGFQHPSTPTAVTLAPGDQKTDVVLRLAPLGVVAGRIRDEDGDPIRRVQVSLMTYEYTPNGRQLSARDGGSTNDLGEYRLFDVPPGKYYLKATPMGMTSMQAGAGDNETLAAAYFPGSLDPSSASQIEVRPGEELGGMDLTLRRVHGVAVRGRLAGLSALGGSGTRVSVNAMLDSGDGVTSQGGGAVTDAQGNFEIRPLSPGSYILTAQTMGGDIRYAARLPVQVGSSDIDGLQLQLAPPLEVNGVVRVEGGVNGRLSQTRVSLQAQSFGYSGAGSQMAKDDGSFTFKNVQPGAYKVMVNAPPISSSAGPGSPSLYLKSVRCGDAEVGDTGVDFSNSAACDLSITFSANGGQIQGKVERDGSEDALQVLVTLIPTGPQRDPPFFQTTGVGGFNDAFRLTGIAPGSYRLFAWESGSVDLNQLRYDPDFVTPYESQGQNIQISENAQETVTLKVVKIPEAK